MGMKKLALPVLLVLLAASARAEVEDVGEWETLEREMRLVLSESYYRFVAGDADGARALLARARAGFGGGFEREVKERISEARAANINEWFDYADKELGSGKPQKEMQADMNQLTHLLSVTARRLDGKEEPAASVRNWTRTAEEMAAVLDKAAALYAAGDAKGAKEQVDVAYFQFYEKVGFERTVLTRISGERASTVEYQFSMIKKVIARGDPVAEVKASLDLLSGYLREDAAFLDSKKEGALGVFIGSLLIILREGFEAILIVGAIIAYLLKSGNKKSVRPVYWGSLAALALSVVMAWVLNRITSITGGQNQEIVEGATMLLAVCVLFYVSNWMVSKAEAEAWTGYIQGKVEESLSRGSVFSLAFSAFLAVFREGAETILFYQALLAGTDGYVNMIWLGLGTGAAALVVVYILIRVLSIRLPLKPFFVGTSVLLFVMCVAFTGSGLKELQEGNVIPVTLLPFDFITVDLLGIYPTYQTLLPQLALLAVTAATFVLQVKRWKKNRHAAKPY